MPQVITLTVALQYINLKVVDSDTIWRATNHSIVYIFLLQMAIVKSSKQLKRGLSTFCNCSYMVYMNF